MLIKCRVSILKPQECWHLFVEYIDGNVNSLPTHQVGEECRSYWDPTNRLGRAADNDLLMAASGWLFLQFSRAPSSRQIWSCTSWGDRKAWMSPWSLVWAIVHFYKPSASASRMRSRDLWISRYFSQKSYFVILAKILRSEARFPKGVLQFIAHPWIP